MYRLVGEKVRVLRLIARLNIGGPAIHATLLTERLDPLRYESRLVCGVESAAEGSYIALHRLQVPGLTVIPELGREIHPVRDLATLLRLYRLMRRVRPHVVHTHTAKAGAVGRLAARLAGVPVIVHTYHGHVLHGYFSPAKTRLFTAIERGLARITDRLLVVSDAGRQDLLARGIGDPARITVLRLGLDLAPFLEAERFRGQLRAELGLDGAAPLVGIVARLVPIKRHEEFLAGAALLAQRVPAARFLVIGDGERRGELEAVAARPGLGGRVRFLGWRSDLARVYADLDVVTLTSTNEGSPVSLIEAMAAARPVVATRVGGVPDLVEDGVSGLLVPAGSPPALAAAVASVLEDRDRARALGEAARKRVHPAFDVGRLLSDVDHLYQELLRGRAGR